MCTVYENYVDDNKLLKIHYYVWKFPRRIKFWIKLLRFESRNLIQKVIGILKKLFGLNKRFLQKHFSKN